MRSRRHHRGLKREAAAAVTVVHEAAADVDIVAGSPMEPGKARGKKKKKMKEDLLPAP